MRWSKCSITAVVRGGIKWCVYGDVVKESWRARFEQAAVLWRKMLS